jgi:hypothetical protein
MCSRKAVASPSAVHATTDTLAVAHLNGLLDAYKAVLTEVAYDRTPTYNPGLTEQTIKLMPDATCVPRRSSDYTLTVTG